MSVSGVGAWDGLFFFISYVISYFTYSLTLLDSCLTVKVVEFDLFNCVF